MTTQSQEMELFINRKNEDEAREKWISDGCPPLLVTVTYDGPDGDIIGEFRYKEMLDGFLSPEIPGRFYLGKRVPIE